MLETSSVVFVDGETAEGEGMAATVRARLVDEQEVHSATP
jgi:hypothetical protein